MNKKYQIFISSTYEDLREERDKVRDAILSMYHFPVGMELFGAASAEQWEVIKETIDTSDYYVLIVGQRYGTVIPDGPDKGISYTEKEFRYAEGKGIPILAFLINDSVPVKAEYVEKKHIKEFDKFKAAVKKGRTVTWWNNADELAQKVTAALHKAIKRHPPLQGWMRVNNSQAEHNDNTSHSTEMIRLIIEKQQLSDDNEMLKKEVEQLEKKCQKLAKSNEELTERQKNQDETPGDRLMKDDDDLSIDSLIKSAYKIMVENKGMHDYLIWRNVARVISTLETYLNCSSEVLYVVALFERCCACSEYRNYSIISLRHWHLRIRFHKSLIEFKEYLHDVVRYVLRYN